MARAPGGMGLVGPVNAVGSVARRRQAPGNTDPELEEVAKKWAEQTAEEQGLPIVVSDPSVVHEVAVLLTSGRQPVMSRPPHRIDAPGIEAIPTSDGRLDHDPGKDRSDDGALSGRIEVRPLGFEHAGPPDELIERRGA